MPPLTTAPPVPKTIRATMLVLLALSVLYLSWGFYQLMFGTCCSAAVDLEYRWIDHRYVVAGQNPWDVYSARQGKPRQADRNDSVDPAIGPVRVPGGNPPWAYPMGFLLIPPSTELGPARLYFAVISALALAYLSMHAHAGLRQSGGGFAWLGVMSVLAMTANLFTLSVGQTGILINAFMAASIALAERGRWAAAGSMLAFALLKPHIGGTFAILHLMRGNLRTLATSLALAAASTAALWYWIDTDPLEYLRAALGGNTMSSARWGYGPHVWIAATGIRQSIWLPALLLCGALLELALLWRYRSASLWTQLAIAAVVGRLWFYHGSYDNVMLVFLSLALLRAWSEGRGGRSVPLAWYAVLASLAAPIPYRPHMELEFLQVMHVSAWVGGLIVLLRAEPRRADPPYAGRDWHLRGKNGSVRAQEGERRETS